jgi:hypothetical protein
MIPYITALTHESVAVTRKTAGCLIIFISDSYCLLDELGDGVEVL